MFWKHNYKIEGTRNEKLQERQIFLSLLSVNKRNPLVDQTQNNTKPCHMKEDQQPNHRRAISQKVVDQGRCAPEATY